VAVSLTSTISRQSLTGVGQQKSFDMWKMQAFAVIGVCALFGFSMSGFAGVHYQLIWKNETTIENFDKERAESKARINRRLGRETTVGPYHNPYDLGSGRKNFEQVFGNNPWMWFLPVRSTPGDGLDFPTVPPDMERSSIPPREGWREREVGERLDSWRRGTVDSDSDNDSSSESDLDDSEKERRQQRQRGRR